MKEYQRLLKKARGEIPSKVLEKARFEVPEAKVLYQGKNTIVQNFSSILDSFRREPKHLMKFLVGELGTAGVIKGRFLELKGHIQRGMINKRINEYANEFVLRHECGRPDTKIIRENRVKLLRCEACGAKHPVKFVR